MCFLLCLLFIIQIPFDLASSTKQTLSSNDGETIIYVALYVGDGDELWVSDIFNYQWTSNNSTYRFQPTIIYSEDILGFGPNPLTRDHFDVLVIGASARSYLVHGISEIWKEQIKAFVSDGGGYVGLCAGAILASCGFEHASSVFHHLVNHNTLCIANIHINDDFLGELQYVLKNGFSIEQWLQLDNKTMGYVDINTSVVPTESTIFSCYDNPYRHLTYAGGPGMIPAQRTNPLFGPINPLLIYNEELMHTKPIHYYRPTRDGWTIYKNVTTQLFGTYAGLRTTYGYGRVILYGPHPEVLLTINGTIHEFLAKGYSLYLPWFLQPPQYVFSYIGDMAPNSNYWIMRRSVAYAAHVNTEDLPPIDETKIVIAKPFPYSFSIYYNDTPLFGDLSTQLLMMPKNREKKQIPVIIGDITLLGYTMHCDDSMTVEFYIDNHYQNTIDPEWKDPHIHATAYTAKITQRLYGLHHLTLKVTDDKGDSAWDSIQAFFIPLSNA